MKFDSGSLEQGLAMFEDKAEAAIRMYAETSAKKLETEAKENRKWTDRTGDARTRLRGSTGKIAKGYELRLAHGVPYGIWLELANEKNYAIIEPTIRFVGTFEIMPGLQHLLSRLGG